MDDFRKLPFHGVSKPRDHMGRQFTYVIHSSDTKTPTHELPDSEYPFRVEEGENKHPSSFHAGTPMSAGARRMDYKHVYRIDRNVIDPLMWRDNIYEDDRFRWRLRDTPPMLTESIPVTRDMIADNAKSKSPRAIPYRNMYEDKGSTSFIIPKNLVGKGVTYLGTALGEERE